MFVQNQITPSFICFPHILIETVKKECVRVITVLFLPKNGHQAEFTVGRGCSCPHKSTSACKHTTASNFSWQEIFLQTFILYRLDATRVYYTLKEKSNFKESQRKAKFNFHLNQKLKIFLHSPQTNITAQSLGSF